MADEVKAERKPEPRPRLRFPQFQEAVDWKEYSGDRLFDQINDRNPEPGLPVLAITQEHGAIPRDMIDYHVSVTDKSIESYKAVQVGDFIISLRSFQGGVEYSQYHGICSPAYVVLRRRVEGSDAYFKHYLKTNKFIQILTRNLEGLRDGKMISFKQFSELKFPAPSPAEQQKIADCLSSVDELIAAQARKVGALKTHKKGLMQQLFPREGKTQPHRRLPEFESAQEWRSDLLGRIFGTSSGGTPDRSNAEFWGGSTPWITTSLVDFGVISDADEYISDAGLENSSAKVFPEKTILVAMYGQGKTRGQVAMLGVAAATNQACAAILPQKGIDPSFVFLNLASRYEEMRRLSNSGGQENLSQGLIQGMQFSYPNDRREQTAIAARLASLEDLITRQTQNLEALKTHKKGLMQQLFPSAETVEP